MYKRQFFNYMTIVLASSTIGMAIYAVKTKENMVWCVCFLCITLISNYISNKVNEKDIDLTAKDKEILEKISKEKKNKK